MRNEILHKKIEYQNIRDLIERTSDMYSDRNAFSYRNNPHDKENVTVAFTKLRENVRALTSKFIEMGIDGKHIAIVGKLSYSWALVYYSVLAAGGVLVPLDRDWLGADLADTAKTADVSYIFADADVLDKAALMKDEAGAVAVYTVSLEGENSVGSLMKEGEEIFERNPGAYFNHEIDDKRLSLLVFTSGTTGKGKGVMLNQRAVLGDMSAAYPYLDFGRKSIALLPPHHTYGSSITLVAHLMIGCEVYISAGLKYVTKEFKEQCPEHLVLVPLYLETIYRKTRATLHEKGLYKKVKLLMKLSNALRKIGIDLRGKLFGQLREVFGGRVRMIISGGAALSTDIYDFFDGIGFSVINGYGITECAPIIAVNHTKNNVRGSVGPALPINELKILEPNENGEGEICVRGENVMLGYYKNEEATKEAIMEDGFFRTGDYGKLGKDGRVFITGRRKNLIILSNGKNVYPEEIESELTAVRGVLDVIVYEGQSKRGLAENKIVAEIYPDYDFLTKHGIDDPHAYFKPFVDDYNRGAVPYKKIGLIKIRETEFPKNTLKKIKRFELDTTID